MSNDLLKAEQINKDLQAVFVKHGIDETIVVAFTNGHAQIYASDQHSLLGALIRNIVLDTLKRFGEVEIEADLFSHHKKE